MAPKPTGFPQHHLRSPVPAAGSMLLDQGGGMPRSAFWSVGRGHGRETGLYPGTAEGVSLQMSH